jgi:hypothetical protein
VLTVQTRREELAEIAARSVVEKVVIEAPQVPDEVRELLESSPLDFERTQHEKLKELYDLTPPPPVPEIALPLMDMSFLSMSNEQGWPRFAIYKIGKADCRFGVIIDVEKGLAKAAPKLTYNFPQPLVPHYANFFAKLAERVAFTKVPIAEVKEIRNTAIANFAGLVPAQYRKVIRQACSSNQFDHVCLIAEAPEWKTNIEVVPMPRSTDPLIVGIKRGYSFLIDKFDVTPLEKYVSAEFTSSRT